jgi:hypothetical protein
MGDPLSLTKPLPGVTKATAVCSDEQQHRLAYLAPNVKACHDLYSRRSVIRIKRKQQEHNQLVPHSIFLACSIYRSRVPSVKHRKKKVSSKR